MARRKPIFLRLALAALLVLGAVKVTLSVGSALRGGYDLQWDSAWALSKHISPFEIDNPAYAEKHRQFMANFDFSPDDIERMKLHAYPPEAIALLWPLASMDWPQARLAWLILEFLFSAMALFFIKDLWLRDLPATDYWLTAGGLMVTTLPWRETLHAGQAGLLALAFFLGALWARDKGWRIAAGLALFVALFKFSLILPLAWVFVRRRDWTVLAVAAGTSLALFLWAAWWVAVPPLALLSEWLHVLASFTGGQGVSPDLTAWIVEGLGPGLGNRAALALAGACLLGLLWLDRHRRFSEVVFLALLVQWTLLFSYHRSYDYLVLIFAAVVAWQLRDRAVGRLLGLLVAWVAWPAWWSRLMVLALAGRLGWRERATTGAWAAAAGWVFLACADRLQPAGGDPHWERAGLTVAFLMTTACLLAPSPEILTPETERPS